MALRTVYALMRKRRVDGSALFFALESGRDALRPDLFTIALDVAKHAGFVVCHGVPAGNKSAESVRAEITGDIMSGG